MKKTIRIASLAVATAFLFVSNNTQAADCALTVATGPDKKGYSNMYADMVKVCSNTVSLCEVKTGGGLDNLNALAVNEADVGFVQVDTLRVMSAKGDEKVTSLQAVMPLHYNYLHVVTSAKGYQVEEKGGFMSIGKTMRTVTIQKFSDLKGKHVVLVGSAALMVRALNASMSYGMTFTDAKTDEEAFKMVADGKAAAAMTLAGWPSGPVNAIKAEQNLTMVPFDAPVGSPYAVRPLSYKNIAVYNNNTLAAPNLLVTRPFKGAKAQEVQKLSQCIRNKLDDLQEGSFQPGWKEIKSFDNTFDWTKFRTPTASSKK